MGFDCHTGKPLSPMRFAPPQGDFPQALTWVLARTFGPLPGSALALPATAEEAVDLARRLGIAPRLIARSGLPRLRDELGATAAEGLARDRGLALAQELRLGEALSAVRREAIRLGVGASPL